MLLRFVIIVGIGCACRFVWKLVRGEHNRHLRQWSVLVAFAIAVIVNGLMTDWYLDIFQQAGVGEGLRGSFLAAFGGTADRRHDRVGCAGRARPSPGQVGCRDDGVAVPHPRDARDHGRHRAVRLDAASRRPLHLTTRRSVPVRHAAPVDRPVALRQRRRHADRAGTLSGIDASLEEAAADLGAPPGRAFRQVTLPLISPALIAGGLLSFTLCLDNTVISSLISGASSTFPVALISATKSEIKPFWGVGAVVLFVMTMALLAFVARVLKKSGDSSSQIAATLGGG
jgi:hypothetical protein